MPDVHPLSKITVALCISGISITQHNWPCNSRMKKYNLIREMRKLKSYCCMALLCFTVLGVYGTGGFTCHFLKHKNAVCANYESKISSNIYMPLVPRHKIFRLSSSPEDMCILALLQCMTNCIWLGDTDSVDMPNFHDIFWVNII